MKTYRKFQQETKLRFEAEYVRFKIWWWCDDGETDFIVQEEGDKRETTAGARWWFGTPTQAWLLGPQYIAFNT